MSTQTTNYDLTKPAATDFYDISVLNGNMDKIDAQMKKMDVQNASAKTTLADTDTIGLQDSADSNKIKKITWANIKSALVSIFQSKITASGILKGDGTGGVSGATAGTDYQSPTQDLTAETDLADGDYIPIYDTSAAAHRKTLWSNIKSKLTTYFNTLYAAITHNHGAGDINSGTLAVARGGTGITSNPSMLTNLGTTNAASVFATSPRPGVTGTLPVSNGGTGNTSVDTTPTSGSTKMVTSGGVYTKITDMTNRTTAVDAADTNYTTIMARGIQASTTDLTAGTSALTSGTIYLVYE